MIIDLFKIWQLYTLHTQSKGIGFRHFPTFPMTEAVNLIEFQQQFGTEQQCIDFLADARWGDSPVCPHCKTDKAYKFKDGRLFKCHKCRQQFTVRIGTIFEESRLPLQKWFLAIYLLTSLKKGISSIQLSKYLGITQKSAWFMLQRIRWAVSQDSFDAPLKNIVEADETYVGGKCRGTRGRGAKGKTAVFGLVERQGKVRATPVENVKSRTIVPLIQKNVHIEATIMTDEFASYRPLTKTGFAHKTVKHGQRQYVDGDAHTNTIENFWSHFKRGINGIYLHVSKKHLGKYCGEYSYRYNSHEINDIERFADVFGRCSGRITYSSLIAS